MASALVVPVVRVVLSWRRLPEVGLPLRKQVSTSGLFSLIVPLHWVSGP
jgi:hypothetical protein